MIQLARQLTGLTVIATASRPESRDWVLALGATTPWITRNR
jgi:NADPH2:quinone reductase